MATITSFTLKEKLTEELGATHVVSSWSYWGEEGIATSGETNINCSYSRTL